MTAVPKVEDERTEQSACDEVASTPKMSRLNSAAPDFVPTGKLPHVSIDRTVSGLDEGVVFRTNACVPIQTAPPCGHTVRTSARMRDFSSSCCIPCRLTPV